MNVHNNFIIVFVIVSYISSLEYKKNKNIKIQTKNSNVTKVYEVDNIESLRKKINIQKSNFMMVFYTEFCQSCLDLLETLDKVSSYEITLGFDFLKVDCIKQKSICIDFEVKTFPTIKVFLKGVETKYIPNSMELEYLLEYVDKINSKSILMFTNNKKLKEFSENYGDVSFLLVDTDYSESSKTYKCFSDLAESVEYKPLFYFAYMPLNKFKNENEIKLPAVINLGINSELNIHLSLHNIEEESICSKIHKFIQENRYPVMKKLDNNYLLRIQRDKRIILIAAIFKNQIHHINFLNSLFHNIAIKERDYIFTYIDSSEDSHLLQFFSLKDSDIPKLIIYDFSKGKYFIDNYSYLDDPNAMVKLNELISRINTDEIKWTTGYIIEDILTSLGISISRNTLMIILLGFITLSIVCIIIFFCSYIEIKQEQESKKKK